MEKYKIEISIQAKSDLREIVSYIKNNFKKPVIAKKYSRMKKIFALSIILVLCMFSLSGCTLSKEEQQKKKNVSEKAEKLANNYIKEKYSMNKAELIGLSVGVRNHNSVWPGFSYTSTATVHYKYNNIEFEVLVDTYDIIIKDNYQLSSIQEKLIEYINDQINNVSLPITNFDVIGECTTLSYVSSYVTWSTQYFGKEQYFNGSIEDFLKDFSFLDISISLECLEENKNIILDKATELLDTIINKFTNSQANIYMNVEISSAVDMFYRVQKRKSNTYNQVISEIYEYDNSINIIDFIEMPAYSIDGRDIKGEEIQYVKYSKEDIIKNLASYELESLSKEKFISDFYHLSGIEIEKNQYLEDYDLFSFLKTSYIWVKIDVSKLYPEYTENDKISVLMKEYGYIRRVPFYQKDSIVYVKFYTNAEKYAVSISENE